jgi:hypothetical protein
MKHDVYLYTDDTNPAWLSTKVTSFMDDSGEAMFDIIFHQQLLNSSWFIQDSVPRSYLSLHYIQNF